MSSASQNPDSRPRMTATWWLAVSALAAGTAAAQTATGHGHAHGAASATPASNASVPAAAEWAEAEVRRVDREARKVTLRHGPIRNLDMPPMTMVFQVADDALLARLREGGKVRFVAEKRAGAYVVTQVEPAP